MIWQFWRRPKAKPVVDETGPATAYPQRSGAMRCRWNDPTDVFPVRPLMTPGQRERSRQALQRYRRRSF